MQNLIINSIYHWDLSGMKGTTPILLKIIKLPNICKENKIRIGLLAANNVIVILKLGPWQNSLTANRSNTNSPNEKSMGFSFAGSWV